MTTSHHLFDIYLSPRYNYFHLLGKVVPLTAFAYILYSHSDLKLWLDHYSICELLYTALNRYKNGWVCASSHFGEK